MNDLNLFGVDPGMGAAGRDRADTSGDARPAPDRAAPLAARMRPVSLDQFRGQSHLLGPGGALAVMLERGLPSSMILWGPPGSGKTTLARLIAEGSDATFVAFSAVTEGIPRVREIIGEARDRLRATGRRTILFCDEIHRFNKAQQDAFLPHVEEGSVVLIGATTENPSFEIVRPLLSRAPVFVLNPLSPEELESILREAVESERGLGAHGLGATPDALASIAHAADGDARRALGILDAAARHRSQGGMLDRASVEAALQHRHAVYDKGGEEHYNTISALHKAVRGSDPDGALYWLARMINGGEDPLYIARRLVRMATEDIGLADPRALSISMAAKDALHFLGSPEGELALAEATIYLATAPKSNRVYVAWKSAVERARETGGEPVPLHVRNAPTKLMRDLRYGEGYRYDPDEPGGVAAQTTLPPRLQGERFYEPGPHGYERTVAERLAFWARVRAGGTSPGPGAEDDPVEGRRQ